MAGRQASGFEGRRHFFFAAARAMRDIMVEHARRGVRRRRIADRETFDEDELAIEAPSDDLLTLDEALRRLELEDPDGAQLVLLRHFAGLTGDEAADVLGVLALIGRSAVEVCEGLAETCHQRERGPEVNGMSEERIRRVEELFLQVCELDAREREAFLTRASKDDPELAAEVGSLLSFDSDEDGFLDTPAVRAPEDAEPPALPERIGRYRIVRLLGEGGMGRVYEAEQKRPERRVALKAIRHGVASRSALRRLEFEAAVLGRLTHPSIAQLYEIGEEQGTPYFAMQYVDGAVSIREYVEQHGFSTRPILDLFLQVCDAVHYAHRKGVIHRDLKPSNILVDASGQTHVIDFGVARSTNTDMAVTTMQTAVGQLIGTLQYMSPEQCLADPNDLDVRSDVYSLGVILYELLTRRAPYTLTEMQVFEATRVIREQEPTRLSTVDRTLRGDLETIVLKTLEKDRERRYQSAADLAADIRRYLASEPIQARPASTAYQLRTFARRNKALVGGVGATILVLLLGTLGTSVGLVRSMAAESKANKTAADLQAVADFQEGLFDNVDIITMANGLYEDVTTQWRLSLESYGLADDEIERELAARTRSTDRADFIEFVERMIDQSLFDEEVLKYVDEELADQPVLQARLLQSIGGLRNHMGLRDRGHRAHGACAGRFGSRSWGRPILTRSIRLRSSLR